MDLVVGAVFEGKVTGITKFGAFVALEGTGKSGLVHISEVANTYVNDIKDFVSEGQTVKVKILSIDENGRIILTGRNGQLGEFNGADNMYPDAKLLEYILQYENGYLNFTRSENGSEVEYVCVFARCQTLGLFYLETYKLQTLIEQHGKHRIKKD